ncbi:MAG: S49 family peptidase [Woeseiaceae bacterium]|nr:S49 family peptidase [Woeseiaceae bacterium]
MSSVAASGGYWISMAADRIVATETTITGSIGVVAMFPTFQRSLGALGVHTDGVGTVCGCFARDREMSDDVATIIQSLVDQDYRKFIGRVATHRGMSVDAVDRIARGRSGPARCARKRPGRPDREPRDSLAGGRRAGRDRR